MDNRSENILRQKFPHLCSFAKDQDITLKQPAVICTIEDIYDLFHLPLSIIASNQCDQLEPVISPYFEHTALDSWRLTDGNKEYSSKRVYEVLSSHDLAPAPMRWIWKSCVMPKHKFFFWLLLQDRLNTRNLLARKNFHLQSHDCVLCADGADEDFMHLFFSCDFSQRFWWKLNMEWNTDLGIFDMLIDAKQRFGFSCFKESLIIGCWSIWNHRNKFIFDNQLINLPVCFIFFKESFELVRYRAKPSLLEGMTEWLDTL
jgi:hypothetical protein